jgi:hypothetical protein
VPIDLTMSVNGTVLTMDLLAFPIGVTSVLLLMLLMAAQTLLGLARLSAMILLAPVATGLAAWVVGVLVHPVAWTLIALAPAAYAVIVPALVIAAPVGALRIVQRTGRPPRPASGQDRVAVDEAGRAG